MIFQLPHKSTAGTVEVNPRADESTKSKIRKKWPSLPYLKNRKIFGRCGHMPLSSREKLNFNFKTCCKYKINPCARDALGLCVFFKMSLAVVTPILIP